MAGSLNRASLIGNLGRDPELRSMQDGSRIASLSLATSDTWRDRSSGERKERTEWHRIVIFRSSPRSPRNIFGKDQRFNVEGALRTRKWTDQGGYDHYTTEIVLGRFNGALTLLDGAPRPSEASDTAAPEPPPPSTDLDDEIPF